MTDPDRQHLDTAIAVLRERIDNLSRGINERLDNIHILTSELESEVKLNHEEVKYKIGSLELRQREQNGNVSKAIERIGALEASIKPILGERYDSKVRRDFLQSQWKLASSALGIGIGITTAVMYLIGVL